MFNFYFAKLKKQIILNRQISKLVKSWLWILIWSQILWVWAFFLQCIKLVIQGFFCKEFENKLEIVTIHINCFQCTLVKLIFAWELIRLETTFNCFSLKVTLKLKSATVNNLVHCGKKTRLFSPGSFQLWTGVHSYLSTNKFWSNWLQNSQR